MNPRAERAEGLPLRAAHPHAASAIGAMVVFIALVAGGVSIGNALIRSRSSALAPLTFTQKWKGQAASLALLERPDVLPLYGSSELMMEMPNRATEFFATHPTGFAVAPLGDRGHPMIAMAIAVGSLGESLRGKRVAVSLSGTWFLGDGNADVFDALFRNHYSEQQAGDVLFFSGLPLELRRRIAASIVKDTMITRDFPLLNPALACLARSCVFEAMVPMLAPLWAARSALWRLNDDLRVLVHLRGGSTPRRRPASVEWHALEQTADSAWNHRSSSNPYGIDDELWASVYKSGATNRPGSMGDAKLLRGMRQATRWNDLELLLATLQATGAHALILDTPLKGGWWDYLGVTPAARREFYRRFDSVAARYPFPTVSFEARDGDRNFLGDGGSHLSAKGWAVYDRTLNAFYHDSIR